MSVQEIRYARVASVLLWVSTLLPVAMVLVLIAARWPEYWKWIAAEDTPMTSLEVAVMYTTALLSAGAACTAYLRGESAAMRRWLLLGAGFFWLCLDDRFAIHERIRDGLLAPRGVSIPFLPVAPGDFILLIYMLFGLAVLPWLLPLWQQHFAARRRFIAGVIVAACAVLLDALDIHSLGQDALRLEQTIEECLELVAQLLFMQGVFLAWLAELGQAGNERKAAV